MPKPDQMQHPIPSINDQNNHDRDLIANDVDIIDLPLAERKQLRAKHRPGVSTEILDGIYGEDSRPADKAKKEG